MQDRSSVRPAAGIPRTQRYRSIFNHPPVKTRRGSNATKSLTRISSVSHSWYWHGRCPDPQTSGRHAPGGGWQYLGNAHVDGNTDHDKIKVHGDDTYHVLQIRVVGSPVEFDHVVVTYGNHHSQKVPTRFWVPAGGSSGNIPLAWERDIAWVEVWYRKANWGNKPEVRLYGRP